MDFSDYIHTIYIYNISQLNIYHIGLVRYIDDNEIHYWNYTKHCQLSKIIVPLPICTKCGYKIDMVWLIN